MFINEISFKAYFVIAHTVKEWKEKQGPVGPLGPKSGRVSYIWWGRITYPTGTTSVYSGNTTGSHYSKRGGATNHLCLPYHPEYLEYKCAKIVGVFHHVEPVCSGVLCPP